MHILTLSLTFSISGWVRSSVIPSKFDDGRSGDPYLCPFCVSGTAVAPSDCTGGIGGCVGLGLELELELVLESSGSPVAVAICSARLASVASAVWDRPRIDGDGVTGSALLPLPVLALPFTTIFEYCK